MMHPDEAAFQTAIDADPADMTARLVFADWLADHCDPREMGYRAMAANGRNPLTGFYVGKPFWWWASEDAFDLVNAWVLPTDWFDALEGLGDSTMFRPLMGGHNDKRFRCRQSVEDAAALAFLRLPPARQLELLNPEPAQVMS